MKIKSSLSKLFILIFLIMNISGCSNQKIMDEVKDKRQFIEVVLPTKVVIGIINDNTEIVNYTNKLDIKAWEYLNELNEDYVLVCSFISYEVIDEPVFLKGDIPVISKSILELYISETNDYFVRNYTQGNESIANISKEAGEFLSKPENMNIKSDINSENILNNWGYDILEIDNAIMNEDIVSSYFGVTQFTEEDLKSVSKEHKLQIHSKDNELLFETNNISNIANYLNGLSLDKWEVIDNMPDSYEEICKITRFALQRNNIDKKLTEMSIQRLYVKNKEYFIEESIPSDYSINEVKSVYLKIPEDIANYILSYK